MHRILTLVFLLLASPSFTQDKARKGDFDFWIGEWDVHWLNPDSSYTYGSNTISWILDSTVIQEDFYDPTTGFRGRSTTGIAFKDTTWRQSWYDNSGGFFEFYGLIEEERKIFRTDILKKGEQEIILRMVFHDIENDAFIWDWESSSDGGESWKLLWQIFYERKKQE